MAGEWQANGRRMAGEWPAERFAREGQLPPDRSWAAWKRIRPVLGRVRRQQEATIRLPLWASPWGRFL